MPKKNLFVSISEGTPNGDEWELKVKKGKHAQFWRAMIDCCEKVED